MAGLRVNECMTLLALKEKGQIVLVVSPGKVKPRLEKQRERTETVRPAVDQVAGVEKAIFLLVKTLPGQFLEQTLPMAVDVPHDEVLAVLIGRIGLEEIHLNDNYWLNRAIPWFFVLCMWSDIIHDKTR